MSLFLPPWRPPGSTRPVLKRKNKQRMGSKHVYPFSSSTENGFFLKPSSQSQRRALPSLSAYPDSRRRSPMIRPGRQYRLERDYIASGAPSNSSLASFQSLRDTKYSDLITDSGQSKRCIVCPKSQWHTVNRIKNQTNASQRLQKYGETKDLYGERRSNTMQSIKSIAERIMSRLNSPTFQSPMKSFQSRHMFRCESDKILDTNFDTGNSSSWYHFDPKTPPMPEPSFYDDPDLRMMNKSSSRLMPQHNRTFEMNNEPGIYDDRDLHKMNKSSPGPMPGYDNLGSFSRDVEFRPVHRCSNCVDAFSERPKFSDRLGYLAPLKENLLKGDEILQTGKMKDTYFPANSSFITSVYPPGYERRDPTNHASYANGGDANRLNLLSGIELSGRPNLGATYDTEFTEGRRMFARPTWDDTSKWQLKKDSDFLLSGRELGSYGKYDVTTRLGSTAMRSELDFKMKLLEIETLEFLDKYPNKLPADDGATRDFKARLEDKFDFNLLATKPSTLNKQGQSYSKASAFASEFAIGDVKPKPVECHKNTSKTASCTGSSPVSTVNIIKRLLSFANKTPPLRKNRKNRLKKRIKPVSPDPKPTKTPPKSEPATVPTSKVDEVKGLHCQNSTSTAEIKEVSQFESHDSVNMSVDDFGIHCEGLTAIEISIPLKKSAALRSVIARVNAATRNKQNKIFHAESRIISETTTSPESNQISLVPSLTDDCSRCSVSLTTGEDLFHTSQSVTIVSDETSTQRSLIRAPKKLSLAAQVVANSILTSNPDSNKDRPQLIEPQNQTQNQGAITISSPPEAKEQTKGQVELIVTVADDRISPQVKKSRTHRTARRPATPKVVQAPEFPTEHIPREKVQNVSTIQTKSDVPRNYEVERVVGDVRLVWKYVACQPISDDKDSQIRQVDVTRQSNSLGNRLPNAESNSNSSASVHLEKTYPKKLDLLKTSRLPKNSKPVVPKTQEFDRKDQSVDSTSRLGDDIESIASNISTIQTQPIEAQRAQPKARERSFYVSASSLRDNDTTKRCRKFTTSTDSSVERRYENTKSPSSNKENITKDTKQRETNTSPRETHTPQPSTMNGKLTESVSNTTIVNKPKVKNVPRPAEPATVHRRPDLRNAAKVTSSAPAVRVKQPRLNSPRIPSQHRFKFAKQCTRQCGLRREQSRCTKSSETKSHCTSAACTTSSNSHTCRPASSGRTSTSPCTSENRSDVQNCTRIRRKHSKIPVYRPQRAANTQTKSAVTVSTATQTDLKQQSQNKSTQWGDQLKDQSTQVSSFRVPKTSRMVQTVDLVKQKEGSAQTDQGLNKAVQTVPRKTERFVPTEEPVTGEVCKTNHLCSDDKCEIDLWPLSTDDTCSGTTRKQMLSANLCRPVTPINGAELEEDFPNNAKKICHTWIEENLNDNIIRKKSLHEPAVKDPNLPEGLKKTEVRVPHHPTSSLETDDLDQPSDKSCDQSMPDRKSCAACQMSLASGCPVGRKTAEVPLKDINRVSFNEEVEIQFDGDDDEEKEDE